MIQRLLNALQSPRLFEWSTTLFALGYGAAWCIALTLDISKATVTGPFVDGFRPFLFVFSFTVAVLGLIGTIGLVLRAKRLRLWPAIALFVAYGWLGLYFIVTVPPIPQAVYVYFVHCLFEALVFVRVKNDLSTYWDPTP